ncbi:MAG TPA: ComEC/Rec2 family competence protein, partial [bacterium]|nr:ComEC/Rec2 family competence protein [bacterium]
MSNKIMACCWFFIIGIVIGTLYAISIDYIPKLYIISLVLFLLGLILLILKKKLNLAIPAFIGLFFLLIAFLIFGYTRYIHLTKITDKNHISNFTEKGWGKIKVEIEGYVSEDPDIFEDKTRLIVTPLTYRRLDDEENLGIVKISGGDIFVQIKKDNFGRENESWYEVSTSKIYGAKVTLRGKLLDPPIASNPGTLDWAQNLKAFGYFAVMWSPEIDVERDASGKLVKVSVNGAFLDWLTNFALNVKEKMLKVIRQTMPYPESAFLGGVTLGLKRGLSGKPCIKNSYYKALLESVYKEDEEILNEWYKKYDKRKEVCDEMIENEFRWAGVSHVLAVSGLHVTIITAMLVGIFSAFKMKKKIYAPLVVFCLIVFCIITGAPPSSTRAVIMNSITLITFVYGGKGLKTSLLFGIAGAAFLILLYNPSAIYQPSFTLSFGAVLSLGLLTGPVEYYLRKLKGLPFWFTIFYLLVITFVANNFWFAFKSTQGLIISIGLYFVLLFLLIKIDSMYPIFGSYGFNNLPLWIRGFISAQFAIQLGMMTPLSSFYFGRMPIAGPYANIIAIPLIGVIVQLGMIAGLIGMIPYVGIYIALLLNATNYLLCKFFLLVAHYSKEWFIYPAVPRLTVGQLLLYYAVILVFVWHMRIIYQLKKLFFAYNIFTETSSQKKITFSLIGLALVLFIIGLIIVTPTYHHKFKITNLSTGFSSASFIEFPDETFWLIDGAVNIEGEYRHPFARRNEGEQTVLQFLISKRITKLDGVILTSLEKEHISGLISVLQYIEVKKIYDPVAPESVNPKMNIKDFFEA